MDELDILREPSVTIVDVYTKSGTHLKRTTSLEDGTVISEEGPDPSKDVRFLVTLPWQEKYLDKEERSI